MNNNLLLIPVFSVILFMGCGIADSPLKSKYDTPITIEQLHSIRTIYLISPELREDIYREMQYGDGFNLYEYEELVEDYEAYIRLNGQKRVIYQEKDNESERCPRCGF